ncbi:hypothetical protein, partial [Barnesiella intestinihominis]|uniref:hypothetical protein n=1 Tax=Barnesiella intestinihominis TaxID=487174 RepID=UPI00265CDB8D
ALGFSYLCHYEDRIRFGIAKSEMRFPFVSVFIFRYLCPAIWQGIPGESKDVGVESFSSESSALFLSVDI